MIETFLIVFQQKNLVWNISRLNIVDIKKKKLYYTYRNKIRIYRKKRDRRANLVKREFC